MRVGLEKINLLGFMSLGLGGKYYSAYCYIILLVV